MRKLETELNDRILRFDGVSIVAPSIVSKVLSSGIPISKLRVTEDTAEVRLFNGQVPEADQLKVATVEPINIDMAWQLPKEYANMDLAGEIARRFINRLPELAYTEDQDLQAAHRVMAETDEICKRGMVEFTKTVIYVIDEFKKQGVVWGVGRGSSCASYVLFILGLHVVDCIKLDVPMSEFFHD